MLSALAVTLLPPLLNTFFMIIFFPEIAAMKTLQQCNIKLFMFFEFLEVLTFWLVTNLQTADSWAKSLKMTNLAVLESGCCSAAEV